MKMYYIPYGDKTVKIEDIKDLELLDRYPGPLVCKTWGMALSSVWWACSTKWGLVAPAKIMIITTGSIIRKGFVCGNEAAFMAAYRPPLAIGLERQLISSEAAESGADSERARSKED